MATIPIYRPVDESWFDHINIDHTNWDGRCPLEDYIEEINTPGVVDADSDHIAWLLSQILDKPGLAGTRGIVRNRRKMGIMEEYVHNRSSAPYKVVLGGSVGDGFAMSGGDIDTMNIDPRVIVTYPDQYHLLPDDSRHKTVLFMREADCQPGYVGLEVKHPGQVCSSRLLSAIVPVGDSMFISSDMYRQGWVTLSAGDGLDFISSGPCRTITIGDVHADTAFSFHCTCWPQEAEEWVYRTRLYGWPSQDVQDTIVQHGCHLVPVGDTCSLDTFLQWRISFLTAEKRLVHSLSHQQFRIYGLLKYFLKQIKDSLEYILGDGDILCSYFIKTLMFYVVENTPSTFWQENYTFGNFRFCLRTLIDWIKKGNCPNYFIKNNNMFKRKVHGENQQKLLHILTDMYHIQWASLSVGTFYRTSIGELLHQAVYGQLSDVLPSNEKREYDRDIDIFGRLKGSDNTELASPLRLLSESQSDTDEFIAYHITGTALCNIAMTTFTERTTAGGNKQKYRDLRKCKRSLTPMATMCASPGLLDLATFHYHTGNYRKSLEMCGELISSPRCVIGPDITDRNEDRYRHLYCGRGYSLFHKLKGGCCRTVVIDKDKIEFCLPQLHLERTTLPSRAPLIVPPLPYAVFLSLMCYHDIGDTRRRDAALLHLRAVNYDPEQGGHKHWILHTLLGICYQTVGDNRRAIRSYTDSLHVQPQWNPAMERIEALRCSE